MKKSEMLNTGNLGMSGLLIFIGVIFSRLVAFFYQLITARVLTVHEFGIFTLLLSILGLLMNIGTMGYVDSIKRSIPFFKAKKRFGELKGTVIFMLSSSFIFAVVISAILVFMRNYIAVLFKESELSTYFVMLALILPFYVFSIISYNYFIAEQKIKTKVLIELLIEHIFKLILVIVIAFLGLGLTEIIVSNILVYIVLFVVSSYLIITSISKYKEKYIINPLSTIKFSIPLLIAFALDQILRRFDKVMISYFIDLSSVGIYSVGYSFAEVLSLVFSSLGVVFIPMATSLFAALRNKEIENAYSSVAKIAFVSMLPLFVFYVFCGRYMLQILYGESYVLSYYSMLIIGLGYLVYILLGPGLAALTAMGKTKEVSFIMGVAVILNIVMNVVLLQILGIEGVAISTSVSLIAINCLSLSYFRKVFRLKIDIVSVIKIVIISVLSFVPFVYILKHLVNVSVYSLFFSGAIYYGMYLIILFIVPNLFSKSEKKIFLEIIEKLGLSKLASKFIS